MARKPSDPAELRLRFTEGLRRRIARAAEANSRSMNAEIIHRVEESLLSEAAEKAAEEAGEEAAREDALRGGTLDLRGIITDELLDEIGRRLAERAAKQGGKK